MKHCSAENCYAKIWAKGLCKMHSPKKSVKKKQSATIPDQDNAMHRFFESIWRVRLHRSEVSGEVLSNEISTPFFHHILPKSKFPDLAYNEENIILLTLDEHASVEMDIMKYEEVNKRREYLIKKYL